MIQIFIPNNNINERKYIINVIFKEFLGLDYNISIYNNSDYKIILRNGNFLIIEDNFFNKYPNDLEYLKFENIPKNIEDLDIFATSFFMLTRWEEYVNKIRDQHNRFPAYESLAYKNNFLDRPIVNEHLEDLKNNLKKLDETLIFKKRKFQIYLTCDVDNAKKYRNFKSGIKDIIDDLVVKKNIRFFLKNIAHKVLFTFRLVKDPYDTFDYMMDCSEKLNLKIYFFLHSSNSSKHDINNDKYIKALANKILKRNHFLGYHPSYCAYKDYNLFIKDKEHIEKIIENNLYFGRQHYLNFLVPTTWQIWEDAKMKWDSSLGYADKEGFRCGTCYPFTTFNILTRQHLSVVENPLIVMDTSFVTYRENKLAPKDMEKKIIDLIDIVKKYNGNFVFLWHNNNFNRSGWYEYREVYKNIINYLSMYI